MRRMVPRWFVCLVLPVLWLTGVWAQIPEEVAATLKLKVDGDVEAAMKELVDDARLAHEWGIEHPVKEPTMRPEAIDQEVSKQVLLAAAKNFPETQRRVFEQEARAKFVVYKRFDKVSLVLKSGETINGVYRENSGTNGILVDNRVVRFSDLSEGSLAAFDPELVERLIKQAVAQRMAEWDQQRLDYQVQARPELERQAYEKAGYLQIAGRWVPKYNYYHDRLAAYKLELEERLRPLAETKHYFEAGYALYEGTWMRRGDADAKRRQDEFDVTDFLGNLDELLADEIITVTVNAPTEGAPAEAPMF